MYSDTNTNSSINRIDSANNKDNSKNVNEDTMLSSLYDHELGGILQNGDIFETNNAILENEHDNIPISKTQEINTSRSTNNNTNNNSTTDNGCNQGDTNNLVDTSNPRYNQSSNLNSENDISHSNSNSIITDNASSGTIEDIINPAFMKPTVLKNNKRKGALMLARDAKANRRKFMRIGSPFSMFNNALNDLYDNNNNNNNNRQFNINSGINDNRNHISRNTDPLYSTDILRNSIVSSNNDFTITNNSSSDSNPNQIHPHASIHRRHNQHKTRPAFINKIWNMVNDEDNKDLIQWADDGRSFIVKNREVFVHEILPRYFKHSNFASFVRQLNMYGWHKVQDIRSGSIQGSSDDKWQFANENFIRGREDLLTKIVRQRGSSHNHSHTQNLYDNNSINHNNDNNNSSIDDLINGNFKSNRINNNLFSNYNINQKLLPTTQSNQSNDNNNNTSRGNNFQLPNNLNPRATLHITNGPESIQLQNSIGAVLNELEKIKYNQIAISKDLLRINKDNELLWKENIIARERYRSQQQILEKILRFMAAMVPCLDQKKIMNGIADKDKEQNHTTNNNNNINGMNTDPKSANNNINNNANDRNNSNINTFNKYRSGNMNINDHTNPVVNGIIKHDSDGETYPQIITPSESGSSQNGIYLETVEDIDNSPPQPILSNRNIVNMRPNENNSKRKNPLLLKNKVTYPNIVDSNNNVNNSSDSQLYNRLYPNEIPNIYNNNGNHQSSNRISEMPFDDGRTDSNIPTVQEINSNTTSPLPKTTSENLADINVVNRESNDTDNKIMFANLQDNIEEQDNSIGNLEDMVTQLTPKLMSPMPILDGNDPQYNPTSSSQYLANQNYFENSTRPSQDYLTSQNIDSMIPNLNQNSNNNKIDAFNLQDYLTNETPSHQETTEGTGPLSVQPPVLSEMSPLMMDDSQFLLNGGDSNSNNLYY